ncbi:hypothetical protein HDU93_000778, partial [Gonapodya sp. JEL0774]
MATFKDRALIDAVENSDIEGVNKALRDGADPNARKRVTLTCDTKAGRLTDTISAESAIVRAVVTGRADVVEALLVAGAVVNGGALEWVLPPWTGNWQGQSKDWWDSYRWYYKIAFPSVLSFALGRGGKSTENYANFSSWNQSDTDKGIIRLNKRGGDVILQNPKDENQAFEKITLEPRPEVIAVLLKHGAAITNEVRAFIRGYHDRQIKDLVEAKAQNELEAVLASMVPNAMSNVELAKLVAEHGKHMAALSSQLAEQGKQITALAEQLTSLEVENAALKVDNAALKVDNSALKGASLSLKNDLSTTDRRTLDLERRCATLETSPPTRTLQADSNVPPQLHTSYHPGTSRLADIDRRVLLVERELGTLRGNPLPSAPPPPMDVKRLLWAVVRFDPSGPDEIHVAVGHQVFVNLQYPDGWGTGLNTTTNQQGFFPMDCLSENPSAPNLNPGSGSNTASFARRVASVDGVGTPVGGQQGVSGGAGGYQNPAYAPLTTQLSGTWDGRVGGG